MSQQTKTNTDEGLIAAVERWLQECVVGLGLCPFAVKPNRDGSIRIVVSQSRTNGGLLEELCSEIVRLQGTQLQTLETTLLIVKGQLEDFADYNDFLGDVEQYLDEYGYSDEFQVASFHPNYQFAGSKPNDAENLSNRAPYPILHVLREVSVGSAVASMSDTDEIYKNNMATMLGLSEADKQRLFPYLYR